MICNISLEQWGTIAGIVVSILAIIPLLYKCYKHIKLRINATINLKDGDYYLKLKNNSDNTISNINIKFRDDYIQGLRSISGDLGNDKYKIDLLENLRNIEGKKIRIAAGEITEIQLTPLGSIYEYRGLLGTPESELFCKHQKKVELYLGESEVKINKAPFSKTIIIKNNK